MGEKQNRAEAQVMLCMQHFGRNRCASHVLVFYASQCEVLVGSVFSQCHDYISPYIYQQHCRHQACRCGSSCLCTALAHYTYLCSKHGVNIDFRSQVSECG